MEALRIGNVDIDIRKHSLVSTPSFVQNDSNVIRVSIYDNGEPADLSNIGKVVVNYKRPDRQIISRELTRSNNVVDYKIGLPEMEKVGVAQVELQLYDLSGSTRLSLFRFSVNIVDEIGTQEVREDNDDVTLLQEIFMEVEDIRDYSLTQAEAAKKAAESAITNWKQPVANKAAVDALPSPKLGDTVQTNDNGYVYRYDGKAWVKTQEYGATALANVNSQLAEKVSKGSVSVFDIDKNKGKFDQTFMTEDFLQQIAGNAPVNAVPAEESITYKQTTFIASGKNLFNKETVSPSKYVNYLNGLLIDSPSYTASDYIKVIPGVTYAANFKHQIAFYDKDKVFISGINGDGTVQNITFTPPSNAIYMRMATKFPDTLQIERGANSTQYEPFKVALKSDFLPLINKSLIPDGEISKEKLNFLERKNLFNKDNITSGFFVSYTTGVLQANSTYSASEFISVIPGTTYTQNADGQLAFYGRDKSYISGINGDGASSQPKTYTIPSDVYFVRLTVRNPLSFQLEKGNVPTPYVSYSDTKLPENILPESSKPSAFLLFLPPEICVAVGRTIELYNRQVSWTGNISNYHFKWDCQVGKSLKRKYSVTGVTIGNYPLTLTVFNNNMEVIATSTSTVKVVSSVLSTTRNILNIGDSLTNTTSTPKPWMAEIRTLSNNKINFVGSRGLVANEKHEGRSGFSSGNYLSATAYPFEGEGVHPFWNPNSSSFDFGYYKTQTGVIPDAVNIWLGTNGITVDPSANAGNIKTIVDKIKENDPNIPIYVTFTLYRGNQDGLGVQTSNEGYSSNRGAWKLEEDRKVFNLMVKLYELLKNYPKLYFIPVSLEHDSEFNFGSVATPVNPRASQTELLPTEATHPQNQGYLQIADIMFSVYAAH